MDTMARAGDKEDTKGDGAYAPLPIPVNATGWTTENDIRSRIFTIRGVQVMLDRDLAVLYGVETRALNQAVKRNSDRFPPDLAFQVDFGEVAEAIGRSASAAEGSRSQFVTLNKGRGGNIKYRPYAFTEHGILMLASVLRSPEATQVGLGIVRAFVAMRKALASVAPILTRLEAAERRQITDQARNEERFDTIFRAMDGGGFPPQKVFFEGKHYDAWSFARKLVRRAAESIVLVDGYCDDATLDILVQKRGGADVTVATSQKSASRFLTSTAIEKFNKQNPTLSVRTTGVFHDRFLILDGKELYHFGASLKDLGRLYCAVSKMDAGFIPSILARI